MRKAFLVLYAWEDLYHFILYHFVRYLYIFLKMSTRPINQIQKLCLNVLLSEPIVFYIQLNNCTSDFSYFKH